MMGKGVDPAHLRLISGGKDYSSNAMVLRDVSFGNCTIHFQVRWETRQPPLGDEAALPSGASTAGVEYCCAPKSGFCQQFRACGCRSCMVLL